MSDVKDTYDDALHLKLLKEVFKNEIDFTNASYAGKSKALHEIIRLIQESLEVKRVRRENKTLDKIDEKTKQNFNDLYYRLIFEENLSKEEDKKCYPSASTFSRFYKTGSPETWTIDAVCVSLGYAGFGGFQKGQYLSSTFQLTNKNDEKRFKEQLIEPTETTINFREELLPELIKEFEEGQKSGNNDNEQTNTEEESEGNIDQKSEDDILQGIETSDLQQEVAEQGGSDETDIDAEKPTKEEHSESEAKNKEVKSKNNAGSIKTGLMFFWGIIVLIVLLLFGGKKIYNTWNIDNRKSNPVVSDTIFVTDTVIVTKNNKSREKNNHFEPITQVGKKQKSEITYDTSPIFKNGIAWVKKDGKYGLIDKNYIELTDFIYDKVIVSNNGNFMVLLNEKIGFINSHGKTIVSTIYDNHSNKYYPDFEYGTFHNNRIILVKNKKWGVVDTNENVLVPFEYDRIYPVKDVFITKRNNLKGIFNQFGTRILEPKYDKITKINEGFLVEQNSKHGFVNNKGEMTVPLIYDRLKEFSDGLALVEKENLYGFVNTKGDIVIPLEYSFANSFSNGLAVARNKKKKWGFIDKHNNAIIPFKYHKAYSFKEGLAKVGVKPKRRFTNVYYGFIDKNERVIIPLEYDDIQYFSEGFAAVYIGTRGWGYIDRNNKTVIPMQFHKANPFKNGKADVMDFFNEKKKFYSFKINKKGECIEDCPE